MGSHPPCELSVVICTRDRAALLAGALESLFAQSAPADTFEIIVVDNSPGRTAEHTVLDTGGHGRPVTRYVHQAALGLSAARNAGVGTAAGHFVAFLDDDARASSRWVEALLNGLRESQAAAAGGAVALAWEAQPPPWLRGDLRGYLGEVTFGRQARALQWPEYPFGLNFAVTRDTAIRLGGFRENLGRVGRTLQSGEEREFFYRLYETGGTVYYCPDAIVRHLVPAERLHRSFFRRRLFWEGRTQRRSEQLYGLSVTPGGVPRASLRALRSLLGAAAASATGDDALAFSEECRARLAIGYLWEAAAQLLNG